jgi:hypothetical protein
MDWTAFIKDNSQALFTLGGVFLGSAITFLGNYLNNRFQAIENEKERLEKRREAKVQLAIELMKTDIKHIDDVNNLMFEILNKIKALIMKKETGELTQEEFLTEFQLMLNSEKGVFAKLSESDTMTDILVYIHGDDIYSIFNNYKDLYEEYLKTIYNLSATDEEREKVYDKLVVAGGKFQQVLREKLISIRDIA